MIWIKVYNTQGEILLAACDDGLLGKRFEEGELQLEISESFYGGERVTNDAFAEHLRAASIVNIVGRDAVEIAADLGMLDRSCLLEIAGVPHAQIARMI